MELSGGKSCLFKVEKSSHNIMIMQKEALCKLMVGFFSGDLAGVWEPTVKGNYQWYGEKPKKEYVPLD